MNPPTRASEADPSPSAPEGLAELAPLLDQYLADLEAGKRPDRARLVAAHPELATQLEPALDGLDFIHRAKNPSEQAPLQLGDFRLIREVGRGGMGVVYEAEQISLRRRVAVKVLRFGAVADETAMQRFQREAETVAHLHHTNIVPIYAIGADEGVRYYAMQFIEGRDLAELVRGGSGPAATVAPAEARADEPTGPGQVTPRNIAEWGLQAAEALAHAHQRGVIHRDIKPSNLILDRDGRIWLTDFGLARRVDDVALSVVGALLGTPRYMSPEQARASRDPVDHRTDIYSLGATLYELTTRRPIFEATSPHEVITQILNAAPCPPSLVVPDVPRDFETIIMKCLAKEPRCRYGTAQALADDLRAFLEGRAISARPPSWSERMVRWTRQHRRSVTTAAVSAAISLAVLLGGSLAWQQHRRSLAGQLMLHTSGPNLIAEVLDAADRPVLASFPVPPPEPVSLPEGAYRVRLSASGLMSETWPLDIRRGELEQPSVQLPARWLWPPRELSQAELPETFIVSLAGNADMLQLTHAVVERAGRKQQTRLQRLEGATGFPAWTNALLVTQSNVPPGLTWEEWQRSFWPGDIAPSRDLPRLVQPAPDLDEDGIGDLVWASRHHPILGAISGADGRVLWWHRSRPEPPPSAEDPIVGVTSPGRGSLVGVPAVLDADADGIVDFFACFSTAGDGYRTQGNRALRSGAQSWVALVSGRTGNEMWRAQITARWDQGATSSSDLRRCNSLCQPAIGRMDGQPIFLLCVGSDLLAWKARSGQPAWEPQKLAFEPRFAPTSVDCDGDGDSEVLLVQRPDDQPTAPEQRTSLELVAWSPKQAAELWRRPFLPVHHNARNELDEAVKPFHRVTDLDGDGRAEILLPTGKWYGWSTGRRWSGIELLNPATGQPRWLARLASEVGYVPNRTVDQFVVGPDLDGDGTDEVFVSWNGFEQKQHREMMNVAAVSGASRALLWHWRQGVHGPAQALQWWHAGPDGWPLLIVPTASGPGGQRMTYFLSLSDGRLQHTLPDVAEVTPADFDGDGILDLSYTVYPQGAARHLVVRGEPPAAWQRWGSWRAGEDYDGDGFRDFLDVFGSALAVRSGRDGHLIWRSLEQGRQQDLFLAPTGASGNLDGDGTPDFIGHVRDWERVGPNSLSTVSRLAAFSGKDGHRIWTAKELSWGDSRGSSSRPGWSYDHPLLDAADLDGDGVTEILCVQSRSGKPLQLAAVAGKDGHLLWELPLVMGGWAPRPSAGRRPLADLNGDGVLDVVLWRPTSDFASANEPGELVACDGRNGSMLWQASSPELPGEAQLAWPEPTVGDLDGDGAAEVIVAVHQGSDSPQGYACDLMALDGRTGKVRWQWRWLASFPQMWPPLLIADRDGRQLVCAGVRATNGSTRIVVLDAGGALRHEQVLTDQATQDPLVQDAMAWRAMDLDGGGGAELLFVNHGQLTAARGAQLDILWTWELPDAATRVAESRSASAGRSAEVLVWSGKSVYGLSGGTGRPLWRGDAPCGPSWGMSDPPEMLVVPAAADHGPPDVQLWWPNHSDYGWATVVRQAWPVTDSGNYAAPSPRQVTLAALPPIPAPGRPLPWTTNRDMILWFYSGLGSLLALGVPSVLIYLTVKRRSVLPAMALAGYAAASVWVEAQALLPMLAAGLALWLLWRPGPTRSLSRTFPALLCLGLALTPLLWRALFHSMDRPANWGAWWWLNEFLIQPLVLALVTLPGAAFWVHLGLAARLRRWKQVRWLLVVATGMAIALALAALWGDRSTDPNPEPYSLAGWYSIWLLGTFAAGLGSLLVLGRLAWNLWRERRSSFVATGPAPA